MSDDFTARRGDQLSRELGIEDVTEAFAGIEREQLETELYKVGCALIAAIEEYGVDGELGISAEGFRAAGGKSIGFATVGDRVYVTVAG